MVGVRELLVSSLHDKWVVAISSLTPAIRGWYGQKNVCLVVYPLLVSRTADVYDVTRTSAHALVHISKQVGCIP